MIKLLDLCCKAGGASMGYYQAANDLGIKIEITGIDIEHQDNYPFNFIQCDAMEYLTKNYHLYSHIHASPPCQKYTNATSEMRKIGKVYNDNLEDIQNFLNKIPLPSVIENVQQAPIRPDVVLRGDMFGLKVLRKRHFELINWFCMVHELPKKIGSVSDGDYCCVFGKGSYSKNKKDRVKYPKFKKKTIKETWAYAMGIDWMKKDTELSEAIPPAYTRYIGNEFFKINYKNK